MSTGTWYYAAVSDGYELWQNTESGHVCVGKVYDQPTADHICERMNALHNILDVPEFLVND